MRKEKSMCLLLCCLGADRADGCYGKPGHRRRMMAALMQSAAA